MDLTHVTARVANPANPRRVATVRFLVDSGAIYSVVPGTLLRRLGILDPIRRRLTPLPMVLG